MAHSQLIEGTWEEISRKAITLDKKKNLILIIPMEEAVQFESSQATTELTLTEAVDREAVRIDAIKAGLGKFKNKGPGAEEIDLKSHGIDEMQAATLREKLTPFAEDWNSPEMDIYDNYDATRASR